MKIGIYSPYLDNLTGGEKYIFTMASCLAKEHKVAIFWDDPLILEKASKKFNLDLKGVRVDRNIFENTPFLKRYIRSLSYDRIIYLSDGRIPFVGAKKLLIHFQFPVEWVNGTAFKTNIKKKFVAKIICNSHFTKHFIDKKFHVVSDVLYPPADVNVVGNPSKKNTILTVGRFSLLENGTDFKKIEVLVNAFKQFQKKRLKDWKFKIVTNVNPSDEKMYEEFEKRISGGSIEIFKNLSYDQIIKLYSESKIYWHAAGFGEDLEKNPERAEHFGISTVEAMSFGAVPVVINAGGQREIIHNNETGYLWDTLDQLVEYTHKLSVDSKLMKKLSESAVDASKNFSKERFCGELNHLIW